MAIPICTCKTADPAWVAEDARLVARARVLQAEFTALIEAEQARGVDHDYPFTNERLSPEYCRASDAIYGPEGIYREIDAHRYGPLDMVLQRWSRETDRRGHVVYLIEHEGEVSIHAQQDITDREMSVLWDHWQQTGFSKPAAMLPQDAQA